MSLSKAKYFKPFNFFLLIVISIYSLLIYFIFQFEYGSDFPSFYYASKHLSIGENPYDILFANHLPIAKKLASNLNPPITLLLFSPFIQLEYLPALIIWLALSAVCGFIALRIIFSLSFSNEFIKKNKINLFIIFLSFFPTLMNFMMGQLGLLILFFIMTGYHFFIKKNDYLSGILWGIIIAIKLFPAFLFLYIFIEKRYRTACIMLLTFICVECLPYLIYGPTIYQEYFLTLTHTLWYGDSWNGSVYGFIFRLFTNPQYQIFHPWLIQGLYLFCLMVGSLWYLKQGYQTRALDSNEENHQPFCLALVMMLLLSPLGWLYYFPLLTLPLLLSWAKSFTGRHLKHQTLWLLAFFLLNFPMDYLSTKYMVSLGEKLSIDSFYFYGLLAMAYLLTRMPVLNKNLARETSLASSNNLLTNHALPALVILSFGLIMPILSLITRIFNYGSIL